MTKKRLWSWALGVSLITALLWSWHLSVSGHRNAGRELWLGYLRGPFSNSLEALNDARPFLQAQGAWSPAQQKAVQAAAEALKKAAQEAAEWEAKAAAHGDFGPMAGAAKIHASLAQAAQAWGQGARGKGREAALLAEAQSRAALAPLLLAQRQIVWERFRQSKADYLEGNALIYSWQEGL